MPLRGLSGPSLAASRWKRARPSGTPTLGPHSAGHPSASRASVRTGPARLPENSPEAFQLKNSPKVRLVSCCFSFINSVCSKLYSYENNQAEAGSPGGFTRSHVVRSVRVVAQIRCLVPQDVCNSDKIGQINNYMYSKIKGEFIQVSKYRDKD